jgi:hypothetical protein
MSPFCQFVFYVACSFLTIQQPAPEANPAQNTVKSATTGHEPTPQPDAADIRRKIDQLGSPSFKQRQAATKELEVMGLPAMKALQAVTKNGDLEVRLRAIKLIGKLENRLDVLLSQYKDLGLPLPPANAPVVLFTDGTECQTTDGSSAPLLNLGFLVKPVVEGSGPVVLFGTQERTLGPEVWIGLARPQGDLAHKVTMQQPPAPFTYDPTMAIILQCKERNWDSLAQALCARFLDPQLERSRGSRQLALTTLAGQHWKNELIMPGRDRSKIAKQLRALATAEQRFDRDEDADLMKALEAALVPSHSRPGSIDALIDDLLDVTNLPGQPFVDPRYQRVVELGFTAVPGLIKHLDDERLTRCVRFGFNDSSSWIMRVQDLVSEILQGIADGELVRRRDRQRGDVIDKAEAECWWADVQLIGEEESLVDHVLPAKGNGIVPNQIILSIITKKYPHRLPEIYKYALEEPANCWSWPIAEAIAKSSLPREKKLEALHCALGHKMAVHRQHALEFVKDLEPERFIPLLLHELDSLPRRTVMTGRGSSEAEITRFVLETDDARVWQLLEKVAKRPGVLLRLEFLRTINLAAPDEKRPQRLAFLAKFLDDSSKLDGILARKQFHCSRIEVRNYAAAQIADLLPLPEKPQADWNATQWAVFRKEVRVSIREFEKRGEDAQPNDP